MGLLKQLLIGLVCYTPTLSMEPPLASLLPSNGSARDSDALKNAPTLTTEVKLHHPEELNALLASTDYYDYKKISLTFIPAEAQLKELIDNSQALLSMPAPSDWNKIESSFQLLSHKNVYLNFFGWLFAHSSSGIWSIRNLHQLRERIQNLPEDYRLSYEERICEALKNSAYYVDCSIKWDNREIASGYIDWLPEVWIRGGHGRYELNGQLKDFAATLNTHHFITCLRIIAGFTKNEGTITLTDSLKHNCSLQSLILSENQISNVGAKAIAALLENNKTLIILILNANLIGDEGAAAIAAALRKNTRLKKLDLAQNEITEVGFEALAAALTENTSLTTLDLYYNKIDIDKSKTSLESLGKVRRPLPHITLSGQSVEDL